MTAAGKTLMPGAVGKTVVRNVEDLRRARNFSLRALSERLAAIGHPLITSAVHATARASGGSTSGTTCGLEPRAGREPERAAAAEGRRTRRRGRTFPRCPPAGMGGVGVG